MRDIALEIPLGALALVGRGQRRDPADARIEALGDALDDAALAGGVAPFEQHDDLEVLVHHPVLQLDQFALQPKQLPEIEAPVDGRPAGVVRRASSISAASRSSSISISSSSSKLSAISARMRLLRAAARSAAFILLVLLVMSSSPLQDAYLDTPRSGVCGRYRANPERAGDPRLRRRRLETAIDEVRAVDEAEARRPTPSPSTSRPSTRTVGEPGKRRRVASVRLSTWTSFSSTSWPGWRRRRMASTRWIASFTYGQRSEKRISIVLFMASSTPGARRRARGRRCLRRPRFPSHS